MRQEFCPQGGEVYTPWADTPLGRHPPGQTTPWADTHWWADTPGQTASAADGMHPTGMHSCSFDLVRNGKDIRQNCVSYLILQYSLISNEKGIERQHGNGYDAHLSQTGKAS